MSTVNQSEKQRRFEKMQRVVSGALKSAQDAHGAIDYAGFRGSIAKRIAFDLLARMDAGDFDSKER